MKFGKKKISRTEPVSSEAVPAGTPTAASTPEGSLPLVPAASPVKAVGESLTQTATIEAPPVPIAPTRTGGAGWFVPPQKPSGFGAKGTK